MQLLGADMDTKRQLEEVFCVLKNKGLAETLKILHNLSFSNKDDIGVKLANSIFPTIIFKLISQR